MIKPGTMYRELGATISQVASTYGCSVVKVHCSYSLLRGPFCAYPPCAHSGRLNTAFIGHGILLRLLLCMASALADASRRCDCVIASMENRD